MRPMRWAGLIAVAAVAIFLAAHPILGSIVNGWQHLTRPTGRPAVLSATPALGRCSAPPAASVDSRSVHEQPETSDQDAATLGGRARVPLPFRDVNGGGLLAPGTLLPLCAPDR
jgi:hypothetical protein